MFIEEKNSYDFVIIGPQGTPFDGESIQSKFFVCPSPTCQCDDVEVEFFHNDKAIGGCLAQLPDKKCLPYRSSDKMRVPKKIQASFEESINAKGWDFLGDYYLKMKKMATESMDFKREVVAFPMANEIQEEGELVSYQSILPYAEVFLDMKDELKAILIDDQFCLRPGCKCNRAFLSFIEFENMKQVEGEPPCIFIDYNTGKYEVEFKGKPEVEIAGLVARMHEVFPKILGQLKTRHHQLRLLYRNYRAQKPEPLKDLEPIKIGRNDPCFCNSGKKYKKCCGATD